MLVEASGHNSIVAREEMRLAAEWMLWRELGQRSIGLFVSVESARLKGFSADTTPVVEDLYRIRIARHLPANRQLICLAHEVVHVRQHRTGNLPDQTYQSGGWVWGPHEAEAIELEKVIYHEFREWRIRLAGDRQAGRIRRSFGL